MNRQERRAAGRRGHAHELDCGCHERMLVPMDPPVCPGCGEPSAVIAPEGFAMPTAAPPGSVKELTVGCACGAVYGVVCAVE